MSEENMAPGMETGENIDVATLLLAEIAKLRAAYQSNTGTDMARRQLLDHFEKFAQKSGGIPDLRKAVATGIFDPGALVGFKGDRTLTDWQTDGVLEALRRR